MSKFAAILSAIGGSFWFVPSLVALFIGGGAVISLWIDIAAGPSAHQLGFVTLQVDGARVALSTIAGGMMTVASIVFSLTFVALSTMSTQLGPRILMFFMHDRTTQVVLGVFIGAFLFSLIVLVSSGGDEDFVPGISLSVAVILAVASFGLMIYFVHHIAASLQADVVVARLGRQLVAAVDSLAERDDRLEAVPWSDATKNADEPKGEPRMVTATHSGYIQHIDIAGLISVAQQSKGVIELVRKPAEFVVVGAPLMKVWNIGEDKDGQCLFQLTIGEQRTPTQQAHFEFTALTEVAVRALSPGVNDPYTAVACVDRMVDGLVRVFSVLKSGYAAYERDGRIVLIEKRRDFAAYLDAAFATVRSHARNDAMVTRRIVEGYHTLERYIDDPKQREMVSEALDGLRADVERHIASERDKDSLLAMIADVNAALQKTPPTRSVDDD